MFVLHTTLTDGDCLFDSIRIMFASIHEDYTNEYLRSIVARPVVDMTDEDMCGTLKNWIDIYKGAVISRDWDIMNDYQHVSPAMRHADPYSRECRNEIYKSMMQKSYWGEQHALRIFEDHINVRLFVIFPDSSGRIVAHHPVVSDRRDYAAFLWLANRHYQPLSFQGVFIWPYESGLDKLVKAGVVIT